MLFSIIIPSWNNLPFLRLCIDSIRKNSEYQHQIIVHVNDGSDGTLEWIKSQNIDYTWSENNMGVCMSCNMMRTKVKTDYIFYLNDDMYLLPGWDTALEKEINSLPDNKFFLSGTMIQPHNYLDVGILANYGDTIENFEEERLIKEFMQYPKNDWCGATWPPNIMHRDIWDVIGGYSIEYSPGMYSDPDLTAKLWMAGVRHFKGISSCRAYQFETRSTGRVKKNDGRNQFLLKWGMTNSTLRRYMTHLGTDFNNSNDLDIKAVKRACKKSRLKAIIALLRGKQFGPLSDYMLNLKNDNYD